MKQVAYAVTDAGRVRTVNEDSLLFDQDLGLYVLCDGISRCGSGDIASQRTCFTVYDVLRKHHDVLAALADEPTGAALRDARYLCEAAIQTASETVHDEGQADAAKSGMGATCVLLAVSGRYALLAHVGDSRAYLVRDGRVHLLTHDHSVGAVQLRKGLITPDEAAKSRYASALTRAVGFQRSVEVDLLNVEILPEDRFLLCSDGLSDYLMAREVERLVGDVPTADLPQTLVDLANERGGKDNITVVAVEVRGELEKGTVRADRKIDALRKIPLFADLAYVELIKVLNIIGVQSMAQGDVIVREGEASDTFYVLVSGEVQVRRKGKEVARLGTGDFFGEMGLIDDAPRSADVVASQAGLVMTMKRDDFLTLAHQELLMSPKLLWALCRVLTNRLRATSQALTEAT